MTRSGRRVGAVLACLLLVVGPVAPAVGAGGPGDSPVEASSDLASEATADTSESSTGETSGNATAVDRAELSGPLRLQLAQADDGDRVPVLVVFETQPEESLPLDSLSGTEARTRMKQLARSEQDRARRLLSEKRAAGAAGEVTTFWSRNALAVSATEDVIDRLAELPAVERIVYDRKVTLADGDTGIPTVDRILDGYNTTAAPSGIERDVSGEATWSVQYIGADAVQKRGVTGTGVNVSVVDSGIDESHPALRGQVTKWKDFTTDNFTSPRDPDGHGTHVAATIAGRRDADRVVGVAPGANLFGAKVFGSGDESGRLSTVLAAFEWSAEQNADVISASLGMPPVTDSFNGTETVASGQMERHNVTLYDDGSSVYSSLNDTAYKPSYVMVIVRPVAVNGSEANATEAAEALDNVSVTFRDPSGDPTTLERYAAGWAFRSGEVPDDLVVRKYKPESGMISTTGNWSLTVQNSHGANVSYEYVALPVYPSNGSDQLSKAVTNLANSTGVLPVIAAGNSGTFFGDRSVGSPGAAAGAITVGASEYRSQAVAPFSSRGPVGYGDEKRRGVTLIAPGTDVISAYPGGEYVSFSGTSMATPHVSGTIALMLDADPTLTNTEIRETLTASAQDVPAPANAAGAGMLDAWAAVNRTNASALSTAATDGNTRELFAGIGDTGEEYVDIELEPATDPAGDSGAAPDLRYASRDIIDSQLEIALADGGTHNGSFTVFVDADSNDSTGDPDQGGAEFRAILNRTFDGTAYHVRVREQAFNASDGSYGDAQNFSASYGYQSKQLVELYPYIYAGPYENVDSVEYHVVSRALTSSTDTDRFPDTGQLSKNISGEPLKTIGIAWNSSAGKPASGVPITFEVIGDDSTVVANATVETGPQGRAIHNFSVPIGDYQVRITDDRGNQITQSYSLRDACIDCLVDGGDSGFPNHQVADRQYNVESNSTVTVNIPVYSDDGNMTPYTGPASAEVDGDPGEPIVFNDLQAENGVVSFTVDLSQTSLDENTNYLDIQLALTSNFSNATRTVFAGNIDVRGEGSVQTTLGPETTTVEPGGSTTVSFQHRTYAGDTVNRTAQYRVTWITDRLVASLSSDLPTETLERLKRLRRAARTDSRSAVRLTDRDERQIRQALANVSTSRTAVEVVTGSAAPTANGVGTFDVSAPVDARFGIVEARANGTSYYSGMSVVAIEERTSQYYDAPSEPREVEGQRYDLRLYEEWDSHVEGDYRVPNDTYEIGVRLYDHQTDSYVDGATVNVYTDGGDVYTVETNGSTPAVVTVDAPNTDWVNASFDEREQQVYAVVQNYTQPDGTAVTGSEYLYPDISQTGGSDVVRPVPELRYDRGSLSATIDYRNSSYDSVPGERTLVILNQGDFESRGDVFVGFVDPGTNESITRNFTDPTPPSDERRVGYELRARTPSIGDNLFWSDSVYLSGLNAETTVRGAFADETTTTVTVNVTDRTGDAVAGAAVVWRYQVYTSQNRSYEAAVPSERPGGVKVGTTGPDGTVTFQIAPDLPEDAGDATLEYTVGIATANTSYTNVDSGLRLVEQQATYITGRFVDSGGNGLAGDVAVASGPNTFQIRNSTADGSFAIPVPGGATYRIGFVQRNESANAFFPRDGVTDLYVPTNVTVGSSNASVGTQTIPDAAGVLNVKVVNESGAPVHGAEVTVNPQTTETATFGFIANTSEQGYYTVDGKRGLEANGTYSIEVEPGNATGYVETTYTRTVTVTNDTTVTVTLNETEPEPTVAVENATVAEGNTTTVNVTLSELPNGLQSFELAVFSGENTTANLTGATIAPAFNRSQSHATVFASGIELYGVDSANNVTAGDGPVVLAQVEVTGVDAGEANLTLEPVVFENDNGATFIPDTRSGTVTVTATATTPTIEVGSTTVAPGGNGTVPLTLTSAPEGLSGFNVTVTVSNATAATLTGASVPNGFALNSTSVGPNGTTLTIKAADTSNVIVPGDTDVRIATVSVRGETRGNATVSVTVNQMDDDGGGRLDPAVESGVVQVRALPPVVGDDRPTDPDGDGRYEDVNGNGRIDFDDLVALFQHLDDPAVTENADAFDFNGNGEIDFDDIVTLFEEEL